MSDENRLIDEQAAKKILERALELDEARQGSMSVEQLRDVARDMSISPSSIDQALEEQKLASQAPPAPMPEQPRGLKRFPNAVFVTVFVLLGLLAFFVSMRIVPPSP